MRKKRRVEVQGNPLVGRPIHPAPEMLGADFVPLDLPAAVFEINRVQAEAVFAGNEVHRPGGVGAEFLGRSRPAGVIARGHDAAVGQSADALEPRHVVPLPALNGNRDFFEQLKDCIGIDASSAGNACLANEYVCSSGGLLRHSTSPLLVIHSTYA